MQRLILFLVFALTVGACNSVNPDSERTQNTKIIISVDEFFNQPDKYLGENVTIKGMVTHVCKHGGQKLFITDAEGQKSLRIDVGEDITEFGVNLEGSEAEFTGVIKQIDNGLVAKSESETKEHHGEEEECEFEELNEKNVHLVAMNFREL
jgi:hypothetical protein